MDRLKSFWAQLLGRLQPSEQPSREEGGVVEAEGSVESLDVIKEPPMEIDGRVMTEGEFVRYVEQLDFPELRPNRIFLHHTWRPTQEEWRGRASIEAMKAYYERQLWRDDEGRLHEGWSAGPHLFVAEDGIWLFSDLRYDGVGVRGHNHRSIHLEMVGNYDHKLPGGQTLALTVAALGILHERLALDANELAFHRDYSTKTCPGTAVKKDWVISQILAWLETYRSEKREALLALRRQLETLVGDQLLEPNPRTALVKAAEERGLLGPISNEANLEVEGQRFVVQVFAEALVVPFGDWGSVESLGEYEEQRRSVRLPPPEEDGKEGPEKEAPSEEGDPSAAHTKGAQVEDHK